MSENLVKF